MFRLYLAGLLVLTAIGALAQAPTGAIAGRVHDESGAVVPKAKVTIANKDTGSMRQLLAASDGSYSSEALPAGEYEVSAEATGCARDIAKSTIPTKVTHKSQDGAYFL